MVRVLKYVGSDAGFVMAMLLAERLFISAVCTQTVFWKIFCR